MLDAVKFQCPGQAVHIFYSYQGKCFTPNRRVKNVYALMLGILQLLTLIKYNKFNNSVICEVSYINCSVPHL